MQVSFGAQIFLQQALGRNQKGGKVEGWSQSDLGAIINRKRHQVMNYCSELVEAGLIAVIPQYAKRDGKVYRIENTYYLLKSYTFNFWDLLKALKRRQAQMAFKARSVCRMGSTGLSESYNNKARGVFQQADWKPENYRELLEACPDR